MRKKINLILKEVLEKIKPPKEDLNFIETNLNEFLKEIKKRIKKNKLKAEIFIGGSFAKGTVISKDYYDVDIFMRFDKEYKNISKLTKEILRGIKNVSIIHGSRDYFRIKKGPKFFIELVPVKKISKPSQAENITDLSYSHVNYIKKKIKNKNILNEIRIAKAFCYATNTYGAESYVNGFSGYGLELLVYYYGSFLKFIKTICKEAKKSKKGKNIWSKEYEKKWEEMRKKIIIDIEKYYKNRQMVLFDVNASKLNSPIILMDPTCPQRNVLAALSNQTFNNFKKECKKFLKNPSIKSFEKKEINIEKIREQAEKKRLEFVLLESKTKKQSGDIAGTKLLKFFKHLEREISRFFEIKQRGFEYNGKKSATYYFAVESKKEILTSGPFVKDKKSVKAFRKKHKKIFTKAKRIYARDKIDFSLKEFISKWKRKYKKRLKEMSIISLKVKD